MKKNTKLVLIAVGMLVLIAFLGKGQEGSPRPSFMDQGLSDDVFMGETADFAVAEVPLSFQKASRGVEAEMLSVPVDTEAGAFKDERQVIQNASLSLVVEEAEAAAAEINNLVRAAKGFVDNADIYEVREGVKQGSVTLRVPESQFERVIDMLKGIALRVEREQLSSRDVTDQLVDLDARLRNLESSEEQYRAIMERSGEIEDVLNVQRELTRVRGEIERLTAQLQNLEGQVSFATIHVSLTSEVDAVPESSAWRPGVVFKQATHDLIVDLQGYLNSLIHFGVRLPFYLVWLITIFIALVVLNRFGMYLKRRFFKGE